MYLLFLCVFVCLNLSPVRMNLQIEGSLTVIRKNNTHFFQIMTSVITPTEGDGTVQWEQGYEK